MSELVFYLFVYRSRMNRTIPTVIHRAMILQVKTHKTQPAFQTATTPAAVHTEIATNLEQQQQRTRSRNNLRKDLTMPTQHRRR